MKQQLMLFQPKQYNELFSSYHSKKNLNPYSRVNLPKISTIFSKEWETAASTSRINKTNNISLNNNMYQSKKNSSSKKDSNVFDKKKDILYPFLTQQRDCETTRVSQFLPYPSITQHFNKIIDHKSKNKKKFEKRHHDLKMIYLNLINAEYNNNKDYKIDSFLTESNENEKTKNDYVNTKINEINTQSQKKLKDMFSQTSDFHIKNEMSLINKIPIVLINSFAEDIYNSYITKEYKTNNIINNNNNMNNDSKKIRKSLNNKYKNLYINNTFFKHVLDNVKHKIEVINENNKPITVLYVTNLINNELKLLQKQISDYKKQYYTENTSNNISKISNYEINSKNTFNFKTNNSSIKDNENISTNNNSSALGSLIIKNIYSKRNNGTKKRKFDTLKMFHIDPNTFFQNKEIISSINKKDECKSEDKYPKKIKIVINPYNKKRDITSDDEIKNKFNLTNNSVDHAYHRIKSKLCYKKLNKKIERTFSEIFLKKDNKKVSNFITEISNKIENNFLYRNPKTKTRNINTNGNNKNNNRGKYNYNIKNKMYYEDEKDYDIMTPKRFQKSIGTNTEYRGSKIKFKNENMKNNYEKIINTIKEIKESNKKNNYYTLNKNNLGIHNHGFFKNRSQNQIFHNNNKIIKNYSDKDNILVNGIKNNNNNLNEKKTSINKKYEKNQDLKKLKISKSIVKKFKEKINDNIHNYANSNNNKIIHKSSNKNININSYKNYHTKNHKNNIINNNKKNILNKFNIKVENSEKGEYEDEESEENEYDEEEDEEEEDDEEEQEYENEEEKHIRKLMKKIQKEKNLSHKKQKSKQSFVNKIKDEFYIINETETDKKEHKIPEKNKKYIKRNSVIIHPSQNLIPSKTEIITPKRKSTKSKSIIHKSVKYGVSSHIQKISHSNSKNKKKQNTQKILFEEDTYEEYNDPIIAEEIKKYNIDINKNNLTKNKKSKRNVGPPVGGDKSFNKSKNHDDSNFVLDENVDDLLNKKEIKEKKKNNINYEKEEELKILKEVEEMDEALTLDEKKFILSEMTKLRNLIYKQIKIDKATREEINSIRASIYKIVNKFFTNWIIKDITMKIVKYDKYKNKLDKLEVFQNYRIYSERNLKILETKYIIPYLEKEKQKQKEEEEKRDKLKRKKLATEEYERFKKLIEEKKRKGLIYDNSYLFKKGKKKKFKLRKEVEEILNTDYGLNYFKKKKIKSEEKKKKINKKKKGKNLHHAKKSLISNVELTQEEKDEEEERLRLLRELEEKERIEEFRDKRLQDFFRRIQKLKNGKFKNFEEELNNLIDEQIDQAEIDRENKEMRMNSFMKEFQFNRVKSKFNSDYKNKQIGYISPVIFTSDNIK